MITVDLNADLAEGTTLTPVDLALLDVVTSASLACGFHAGNRQVMRETARACVDLGVTIGAHVSYRDRAGFGRRPVERAAPQLVGDIVEQCQVLAHEVAIAGGTIDYVKPHGALYNRMGADPVVAASVIEALASQDIRVLVAQAGTAVVDPARQAGLRVVPEGFPDRGYRPDGLLAQRGEPGAQIDDPAVVGQRALSLATRGGVEAVDGTWRPISVETLCVHGDAPNAAATARAVQSALAGEGITLCSFLATRPGAAGRQSP